MLESLGRRKLVQWALAYLAGAWVALQVLGLLDQAFDWPAPVLRAATVVLAVGFLAVLVLAWYHGEQGAQRVSGLELLMLATLLLMAGAALALLGDGPRAPGAADGARPGTGGLPPATGPDSIAEPVAAALPGAAGTPVVAEQGSIAVLPFVNLSSDREQEYFSDGLTEELLNVLSQVPALRVVSRTSAFAFKGKNVPLDSIARALRVVHVLEGSVRKAGDRVRITAQLVDARSGYHLWSENYDRSLRDVFAVQDEIARAVVAQLRIRLSAEYAAAPLVREETADPAAHTLLLQGSAARRLFTPAGVTGSIGLLRRAVARDPAYARAHQELAASLWLAAYERYIPYRAGYREARVEAERALELDPSLADADYVLGRISAWNDWNWAASERHFRKALEANPNLAAAHSWLGRLLALLGRREEAIAEAHRATALDPLGTELRNNLGSVYVFCGDAASALREYEDAATLGGPQSHVVRLNLAWTYAFLGRTDEALRTARQARALFPDDEFALVTLADIAAGAGLRDEAERLLREVEAKPDVSPYLLATVHARLGRTDQAFRLLERAVAERDDFAAELAVDPAIGSLRGDPRMAVLIRKAGLPE